MNRLRAWGRPNLDGLVVMLASLVGLAALLAPFFSSEVPQEPAAAMAHAQDAPMMTMLLIALCLAAILATLSSSSGETRMNAKMVAILGVLTAANAVLRAVPGPAGFAAVFMLPILCGYLYGSVFGFLLGALSLLVSALIGAGLGPWLPYQMLATGWVGLTSAWLPNMRRWGAIEVLVLAVWGLLWGLLFGIILNVWFWPFVFQAQQAEIYWQPGTGLTEAVRRYLAFYAVTSLWWDMRRAVGNALLIGLFGAPLLKLLRRFQKRFHFVFEPSPTATGGEPRHTGEPRQWLS